MKTKIIFLIVSFLIFIPNLYSFEAYINTDSRDIKLNEKFNINLKIDLKDSKNIKINRIKWIENFDLIWQSQSQQSKSRTTIINWKTDTISKQIIDVNYLIKPKKSWEYILWPIILSEWKNTYSTNSLVLNVSDEFINNKEKINKYSIDKNEGVNFKYTFLYLFTLFLILIFILIVFLNNNKFVKKYIQKLLNKFGYKKNINTDSDFNHYKMDDFEKNQIINYPDINDQDFVYKIDDIIRQKISKKYNLKGINKLTYNEILQSLDQNLSDKFILENIFDMISKIKYSNILISKSQLLELVKKI